MIIAQCWEYLLAQHAPKISKLITLPPNTVATWSCFRVPAHRVCREKQIVFRHFPQFCVSTFLSFWATNTCFETLPSGTPCETRTLVQLPCRSNHRPRLSHRKERSDVGDILSARSLAGLEACLSSSPRVGFGSHCRFQHVLSDFRCAMCRCT